MSGQAERSNESFTKAQRCPFCHESIRLDEEAWVACTQCLGRHHQPCWEESGSCSSCSCTTALASDRAVEPPLDVLPAPERPGADLGAAPRPVLSEQEIQRETARLFEESERSGSLWGSLVLTPLTGGLYPVVQGELRLAEHLKANAGELEAESLEGLEPGLRARVLKAREQASSQGSLAIAFRRLICPTVMLVGLLGCLTAWTTTWTEAGIHLRFALGFAVLSSLGLLGYLHAFRESVRSHELHQLFVRLVSRAVPPEASKDLLDRLAARWSTARLIDGVLIAVPLAMLLPLTSPPIAGWLVAIPFLAAIAGGLRVFGTLSTHLQNEAEADEVAKLYEPRGDAKG